jgi:hypothetical protein
MDGSRRIFDAADPPAEEQPRDLSEVMDYSSYDLRTTIRLIILSGESRRVDITKGRRTGSVFINEGEIYRVEADDAQGDEAFFEILSWKRAVHRDSQQNTAPERNVRISTDVFLDLLNSRVSSID